MRSRGYLTAVLGAVCAALTPAQQYDPTRMGEEDQALVRKIEAAGPKENLGVLQEVMRGLEERAVDPETYANVRPTTRTCSPVSNNGTCFARSIVPIRSRP